MPFCPKCGNSTNPSDSFCNACGARINKKVENHVYKVNRNNNDAKGSDSPDNAAHKEPESRVPANLFDALGIALRKFFVARGRASQAEFLYAALFFDVLLLPLDFVDDESDAFLLLSLPILALIPFFFCLCSRRLHDMNCSRWALALILPAEIVLELAVDSISPIAGSIIGIAFDLILGLIPGSPSDNKYGSKPQAKTC